MYRSDTFPQRRHFSTAREIGFIAQDVETVLPQVVTTDSDGFKGVAYSRIVPVLVEGWKAQQATIARLDASVAALEQHVESLQAMLEQLRPLKYSP